MGEGSCLCGKVRYVFHGNPSNMLHCHCSICRKSHGSSFATFAAVDSDSFQWTSGEPELRYFAVSDQLSRCFCGICGSIMPYPEGNLMTIPAGTLTTDCPSLAVGHIFTASRAPWVGITDTLKQYETFPRSFQRAPVPAPDHGDASGSCLCNQVAFRLKGNPVGMMNCHCNRCRRSRSAAHATNLFVREEDFAWLRGADSICQYRLPEAKGFGSAFCTNCGSLMPRVTPGAGRINIPAGCLNVDPGVRPMAHIYTDFKANWFEISDDLPRFSESRRTTRS